MSVTGEADGHPVRVGVSLIDIGTGVWAALAIVAALHEGQSGARSTSRSTRRRSSLRPYQLVDVLAGGDARRPARHGVPADRPVPGVRDAPTAS